MRKAVWGWGLMLVVMLGWGSLAPAQAEGPKIEMVAVPGGCVYPIGLEKDEKDEKKKVCVTSDFQIGKYEVTQEQWLAVMGSNPSKFKGPRRPVENVSWNDTQEFIKALNQMTGKQYRLPSEKEWVYAALSARNNQKSSLSGCDTPPLVPCGDKWHWSQINSSATHEVGGKLPNKLGIYDMSGNVWEWCADSRGELKALHGGSWYSCPGSALFEGSESMADLRLFDLGFRLVLP